MANDIDPVDLLHIILFFVVVAMLTCNTAPSNGAHRPFVVWGDLTTKIAIRFVAVFVVVVARRCNTSLLFILHWNMNNMQHVAKINKNDGRYVFVHLNFKWGKGGIELQYQMFCSNSW